MDGKSHKSSTIRKTTKKPTKKAAAKAKKDTEQPVEIPPAVVVSGDEAKPEAATWSNGRPKSIRKMGRPGTLLKSQLEEEQLRLKNEKLKLYLSDWRKARDREIAVAILEALKATLLQLKDDIASGKRINQAIDKAIKGIGTIDYDIVLASIENDDEEGEED